MADDDVGLPEPLRSAQRRGWAIFPVHGKIPCVKDWQRAASTDPELWLQWAKEFPACGWAAPTGTRNGFDVVDADTVAAVEELEARLPPGPRVRTGGGGMHFYLGHVDGAKNWAKRIPGCDYRAEGGLVVLAGSPHASGRPYDWVGGTVDLPIPGAPTWVVHLHRQSSSSAGRGKRYEEGERNDRLFRVAVAVRSKGGDVLAELRQANAERCAPPLLDTEVRRIAESALKPPAGPRPQDQTGSGKPIDGCKSKRHESFVELPDGRFAEEILLPAGPAFLVYTPDPESWRVAPTVTVEGEEVFPRPIEPGLRDSLMVPSGVDEYADTETLIRDAERWALEAYDPRKEGPIFRLWVRLAIASWLLDAFYPRGSDRYAPVLPAVGPPESGKGRLLLVSRFLTYRSLYMLKTTRVPSIFRALEGWNGTLILDEADLSSSTEASEFVEFLNARAYGVPIIRYSSDSNRMTYFQSFGLTVLAIRKSYLDAGFNSRTIPLRAELTDKSSEIDLVASKEWIERGRALQRRLLLWRLRHLAAVRAGTVRLPSRVSFPKVEGFRVRAAVLPLLALGTAEPVLSRDLAALVAEIQVRLTVERADSPEGILLGHVYDRLGSEGFTLVREGRGHAIEERRTETSGAEGPVNFQTPLTLRGVSENLGRELSSRDVSRLWRAVGQEIKARVRRPERLYSGVLLVTDPERLDREFRRFVPDAEPRASLFGSKAVQTSLEPDWPAQEVSEHAEQANNPGPRTSLYPKLFRVFRMFSQILRQKGLPARRRPVGG